MKSLWLCDYYPRPHDTAMGIWGFKTMQALQNQGVDTVGMAPTPWIPRALALNQSMRHWAHVPDQWDYQGIKSYYLRCLHYPHRWVAKNIYNTWPYWDSEWVWKGCKQVIDTVIHTEKPDVLHANFVFPSGYLAWRMSHKYHIPYVMHERSPQRLNAAMQHSRRKRLYEKIVHDAHAVITLNSSLAQALQGMTDKSVHRIPAAADMDSMSFTKNPGISRRSKPYILSVGALNARKGHWYLIHALELVREHMPDLQCVIVGDGPERARLERLIRALNLQERVLLMGRKSHAEVMQLMHECVLFALPSQAEAFGTVYAEALSMKKPIIACHGEGIGEYIQDGVHGILVEPKNPKGIANAIQQLIEDVELRLRIGKAGLALVEARLSYAAIAQSISSIYKEILNGQE